MAWIILLSIVWALRGANGAAIDQQVLHSGSQVSRSKSPIDLAVLRGDIVITSPLGQACYKNSFWYDPEHCKTVEGNKASDAWVSDQPSGYYYANWASCQSEGETCSLPLNSSDPNVIPDTAQCYFGSVPPSMFTLSPSNIVGDVQNLFVALQKNNVSVIVKNTGHDWKGRSSAPPSETGPFVVWTHPLKNPTVPIQFEQNFTPLNCPVPWDEEVFHFGPGETWEGAYGFAEQMNRSVVGGTCGTVGIAGWLHGGGHSPLTPVHGMGADNVRQVEIVTADGKVQIANECYNSDLFFAIRGGGGNTFGIVTNITYKALPKFQVQDFHADISNLSAVDIEKLIGIFTSNATLWAEHGWGGYIKIPTAIELSNSNSSFTLADAKADMANVTSFLDARSVKYVITTQASWFDYYQANLAPPSNHVAGWSAAVASRLIPASVFEDEERRDNFTGTLIDLYEFENRSVSTWLMLVTPTKFPHTTTSALHPTWASAIWSVRIHKLWDQYYYSAPDKNRQFFNLVHQAIQPLRKITPNMGISINEADIWEEDYESGFWGSANSARLSEIKSKVDPANLLSNWMAVGWNETAERYKCYPRPT